MYTLDTKKWILNYVNISIICFTISIIYEIFSHNVYSAYMICAGAVPLILGIGGLFIKHKNKISFNLYNSSIALITIGMYINGILEIYGTTNNLVNYYFIFGLLFLILSIIKNKNSF